MSPRQPACRAIEPDLLSMIDSLRSAPLADDDATLALAQLAVRLSDLRSRIPRRRWLRTPGRYAGGLSRKRFLPDLERSTT